MVDEALIRRLEGLAVDCDNTDGWNYAAEDIREAVRILAALATPEAEPGLIDEIHELAGMVGATFTPHEKPTPEAEPVGYPRILYVCEYCQENNPEMCGRDRDDLYVTPDGRWLCDSCLDEEGIPSSDCVSPPTLYTHPSPPITEAEVEAAVAGLEAAIRAAKLALFVINKQGVMPNSSWKGGFDNDLKIADEIYTALTAFIKARRQG